MTNFLGLYNLARLNHEEIEIPKGLVTTKEIEQVIRNLPTTKVQDYVFSLVNSTKHLKKN